MWPTRHGAHRGRWYSISIAQRAVEPRAAPRAGHRAAVGLLLMEMIRLRDLTSLGSMIHAGSGRARQPVIKRQSPFPRQRGAEGSLGHPRAGAA